MIQFDHPWWLVLIPVLGALIVLIALRSISGLGPIVRWGSIVVRLLVVALLCGALARPSWRDEATDLAVTLVLDRSASMPEAANESVRRYLDAVLANARPATDRLGVISTAATPRIESIPAAGVAPERVWQRTIERGFNVGNRDATDLASAVRAGLAITPANAGGRLLVVSDGNETVGSLLSAAEQARARGIPIDVLPIRYTVDREVILDRLVAPAEVRVGELARVRFVVRSTHETLVELSLEADGRVIDLDPDRPGLTTVQRVTPGVNVIERPVRIDTHRPHRITGMVRTIDPKDDTIIENNRSMAVVFVHSRASVLILASDPAEAQQLASALRESEIDATVALPAEIPQSIESLQEYSALVLMNVAASQFTQSSIRSIARYVGETGGGLVMIGGPRAFGAGGWIGTEVADALPVLLDPPQRRELPRGALALVIDASGSMHAPVGDTGLSQLEIAKASALAAFRAISERDLITLITFSSWHRVDVPLAESRASKFVEAVNRLAADGGTNMWPAIEAAGDQLADAEAGQKHIIVLTDGQSMSGDVMGIIGRLQRRGITLSAIGVGDSIDAQLLSTLATALGGTFYHVTGQGSAAKLPQLFVQEAQIVRRSLIWEGEPFQPVVTDRVAEPMRNMPAQLPAISGYIITADRHGLAQVTARAPNEDADPIVAQWQYGLGRTMVFTSDATTRWSTDWTSWAGYRAFWDQHIRWVLRPAGTSQVHTVMQPDGDITRVIITAIGHEGDPINFARFNARVVGPDGEGSSVEITQTGPGRYEGWFESNDAGAYLFASTYSTPSADGRQADRGSLLASTTKSYADEHRAERDHAALLIQVAELTGGRVLRGDANSEDLFLMKGVTMPVALTPLNLLALVLAASLFVVDVAVRRVRLDVRAIARKLAQLAVRAESRKEERIDALMAARTKARDRLAGPADAARAQTKFEPAPSGKGAALASLAEILDSAPPRDRVQSTASSGARAQSADPPTSPPAVDDGMSRLLLAKKRARQEIDPGTRNTNTP